ncbi:MAG: response regulator [Spirochaetales bacterium]|nr:response regulator [Spirochaetales bacterium]
MRALIVDDDFISRKLMLKYLRAYCECDVAISGDEARTAFQLAWTEQTPYDVIYLDIVIPGQNGLEVLKYIREYEVGRGITDSAKVIMVSGLDDQNQVKNAYQFECDSYLIKPITHDKVLHASNEAGVKLVNMNK